ncbi:MAG: hypothetical protein K2K87_11920 [Lachnospiraceae bacterium]|nr:hypothetical protein [Lachnospiraceae bacterium]
MGKRMNKKQGMRFAAWLLALTLVGTGCGAGGQVRSQEAENEAEAVQGSQNPPKTGALHACYFFEEDGIALSSGKRFMYSDWEPVEFDVICMDPTCNHLAGGCSARSLSKEGEPADDFCLIYGDRLIIIHATQEYQTETLSEEGAQTLVTESSDVYSTEIYEADPDGSNRRKKASFPGAIDTPLMGHAAVLADGKLYFGGPTRQRDRYENNMSGGAMKSWSWTSHALYCLDLEDYTVETFAVTEDAEGVGYMYQFYEYEGMVYAVISNFDNGVDCAIWYRIDPASGGCGEILRFDPHGDLGVPRFNGVIGNTVYYTYEDSNKTLYARDINAGAEEREIMTVDGEDRQVIAFILDGKILFQTDGCYEGEDRMTEYAVLDKDGNLLDTIQYDEYITFGDVIGDKILYYATFSDCDRWWAYKEDLADLPEKGVGIGYYNGAMHDSLSH